MSGTVRNKIHLAGDLVRGIPSVDRWRGAGGNKKRRTKHAEGQKRESHTHLEHKPAREADLSRGIWRPGKFICPQTAVFGRKQEVGPGLKNVVCEQHLVSRRHGHEE